MAAFNGIRVLPDIPKNIPKMENLIQEFETGFGSSGRQDSVSELSTSSGGSFVKRIVEAYESSVRASIENAEQEHARKRSGLFNATIRNQKNVEKSDSSISIYDELGSSFQRWTSLKNTSEIPSAFPVINKHDLEDDFVTPNRYRSKSDKKTDILKTWSGISFKINKYGFMRERTDRRSGSSKRNEMENLKTKDQIFYDSPGSEGEYKSTNNMSLICSSPLEDEDTYYDDPLDDILTNSRDSSSPSNNSYKNLQGDLYNFENEGFRLSTSSPSLNSSSRSLCNGTSTTTKNGNDSLLLGSSLQDITVISSKDDLNNRINPQIAERILKSSSDLNRDSPRVIGVSLKRPIKIDNDTSVTWLPVLNEKLPQKKSLKKLLSMFHRAKLSLNYRKIGRRLKRKQHPKREHIFDSGFIERCPSLSSTSSQKSWHSDVGHVDDEPSTSPTFGTFGRPKCVSERCTERTARNSMMLTEVLDARRPASDFAPFAPSDSNPRTSPHGTASSGRTGSPNVESSSSVASFSNSRVFCRPPSLPKHPHLIRSSIPKHPFVAKTKMDQMEEGEAMQGDEKIERPDVLELTMRCPSTPIPVPQSALNVLHPKMSDYVDLSVINNYDLPKSHRSTSALDEVVSRRQAAIYDVPRRSWLSSLTTDSLPIYGTNPYMQNAFCMPRFATVSPKNFRFSLSHEKSRAIEKSFDN